MQVVNKLFHEKIDFSGFIHVYIQALQGYFLCFLIETNASLRMLF